MQCRAWFRIGHCRESFEAHIRAALIAAGVDIEAGQADPAAANGIVCFEQADDEVLALLHEVRNDPCRRVLAVMAGPHTDTGLTWRLLHAGASDVLFWSDDAPGQIAARLDRWREVDDLATAAASQEFLIGESRPWRQLVREVVEAARFSTMPVLLMGESGTGKEQIARLISTVGASRNQLRKELVTVDCGSLVPELSGSEFFGHERGAFTGAHTQREGAFAMADGATLLLDEIGEIPLALQAQLLRAIQEKSYKRVGGNLWQKTNFRLVCATNRDLHALVQRGQFRLDLFHRIAGCVLRTPPLAERKEDILMLARHFLRTSFPGMAVDFDPAVSEYLLNRRYPGNVRELRQLMERIALRHVGPGLVTAGEIPEDDRPTEGDLPQAWPDDDLERSISNALATGASLTQINRVAADTAIRIAVRSEQGNLQRAAARLGITDRALQMRRAADRQREQKR